jgi:hypothetical protein
VGAKTVAAVRIEALMSAGSVVVLVVGAFWALGPVAVVAVLVVPVAVVMAVVVVVVVVHARQVAERVGP